MSDNLLPQQTETSPEMIVKMNAWANMGRVITNKGVELQAREQAATSELIMNPTTEQVVDSESRIKEASAALAFIETDRKAITSKFDAVTAKLMEPEKAGKAKVEQAKQALLAVKQQIRAEQEKTQAKIDEAKRIRETLANHIAQQSAAFRAKIQDRAALCLAEALAADVTTEALPEKINDWKIRCFKTGDFAIIPPTRKPAFHTQEEVDTFWGELHKPQPVDFMAEFYQVLQDKFAFYDLALRNKESALKASADAALAAKAQEAATLASQETANKLEAIATSAAEVLAPDGKALKQKWAVDMPDDLNSAITIMAAFVANAATAKGGIRVKSWQRLSVEQMAASLAWCKNNDDRFQPSGINFKLEDKL